MKMPCTWCSGTGFVIVMPCRECKSTGQLDVVEVEMVKPDAPWQPDGSNNNPSGDIASLADTKELVECTCDDCDRSFLVDRDVLDEADVEVVCPHCGSDSFGWTDNTSDED